MFVNQGTAPRPLYKERDAGVMPSKEVADAVALDVTESHKQSSSGGATTVDFELLDDQADC